MAHIIIIPGIYYSCAHFLYMYNKILYTPKKKIIIFKVCRIVVEEIPKLKQQHQKNIFGNQSQQKKKNIILNR